MKNRNVILMILDGWGIGDKSKSDVIFSTPTPNYDKLLNQYPNATLLSCGENVGLPDGQMGNSEVGHLNIGAGRIVYQDLVKINNEIKMKNFFKNPQLLKAFDYAKQNNKKVHFMGLVSDGGVHSLETHLFALIDLSDKLNFQNTYIHALTDGRDTDPKSSLGFIKKLTDKLKNSSAKLASLVGRYYTMDRDKRWERIKIGYDLMVNGIGEHSTDILNSIEKSYQNEITDEFIKPVVMVDNQNNPIAKISEGDVVICFNYRTDRLRQISIALSQQNIPDFGMKALNLQYYTMTRYDESFQNVNVIYEKDNLHFTLGEIVANQGLKQLRIAETEKYAHVTFFFSGGREEPFKNEERILVSSPKVATYDLQPEMSALIVKDKLIEQINSEKFNLIVVNFANGDMVGHTGIYSAIQKAVETIDLCIGDVTNAAKKHNYDVLVIADHGNADFAINSDNSPNTAHSLNPVPIILISDEYEKINSGILADVAPTILNIMGINIPIEMTGKVLI
ncbi:MAG: 2,3-bisphosphoglycerate-independent phosphoglycerate mutase [Bacteroidales bacterium]|jgi:2,3-bisphosphoglycerate-independent phosphoglycerate mutase|nr:2,3-bisphosphoglycerate-independent phosphoglycerate mutase [Bacteroidales bacterium]